MSQRTVAVGRNIVKEVNELLQAYAAKNGFKVEVKNNFTYTPDSVYLKGVIFHIPQPGVSPDSVLSEEEKLYDFHATVEKLPARGTTFVKDGKTYRIHGWKARARKNQVLVVEVSTNQKYSCPASTILHYLK